MDYLLSILARLQGNRVNLRVFIWDLRVFSLIDAPDGSLVVVEPLGVANELLEAISQLNSNMGKIQISLHSGFISIFISDTSRDDKNISYAIEIILYCMVYPNLAPRPVREFFDNKVLSSFVKQKLKRMSLTCFIFILS